MDGRVLHEALAGGVEVRQKSSRGQFTHSAELGDYRQEVTVTDSGGFGLPRRKAIAVQV